MCFSFMMSAWADQFVVGGSKLDLNFAAVNCNVLLFLCGKVVVHTPGSGWFPDFPNPHNTFNVIKINIK